MGCAADSDCMEELVFCVGWELEPTQELGFAEFSFLMSDVFEGKGRMGKLGSDRCQ